MDSFYSNNEFDITRFNNVFDEQQEKNIKKDKNKEELELMKKVIEKEKLHDMSFGKIFVKMKDEVFGILYDILSLNFDSFDTFTNIFTKDNRLFYFGLFLLIICILLYIVSYLFFYPKKEARDLNVNANLSVPNDYKFSYYPYNKQNASDIVESKKMNNILKNQLRNSNRQVSQLRNELNKLSSKMNEINDMDYEIDNQEVDSDIIPKEIKDQIKNQIKQDLLANK